MNFIKKSLAVSMAVVMAGSFAACSVGADTNWVAKSGELTVPAGIYIWEMMNQYYDAQAELGADVKDPLKQKIGDASVPEVITTAAKADLSGYVAVEKKFDELGLTMDEATKQGMAANAESYWGYIGASYEKNGISLDSYTKAFENDAKKTQIFQSIYGEGGTEPVAENLLKDKFLKDFAKIIVIPLNYSTSEDVAVKATNDKEAQDLIEKYYQKMNAAGANIEDIVYEARKEVSKDDALEKPEAGTSYTFVSRDSSQYPDEVTTAVFAAKNGVPTKVEAKDGVYLFVRYDIAENEADFVSRKSTILQQLKSEEFNERVIAWGAALTDVTYNEAAFKRYTPQKLKMD